MNKRVIFMVFLLYSTMYGRYRFSDYYCIRHPISDKYTSNVSVSFAMGKAHNAYNSAHEKINILGMLGTHPLHTIGIVQQNFVKETVDMAGSISQVNWGYLDVMTQDTIVALNNGTNIGTYGQFDITGNFSYKTGELTLVTPSYKHFYCTVTIPYFDYKFSNVTYTDLTPEVGNGGYNKLRAKWADFKVAFDAITKGYLLGKTDYNERGFGDVHAGLHYFHDGHDRIKGDLSASVIFPTGKVKNENQAFSVAHGYDGHWGLQFNLIEQLFVAKYLSLVGSFESTIFRNDDKEIRLKTFSGQQGFLFLASGKTTRHKGALSSIGLQGLVYHPDKHVSLCCGYRWTHSNKTFLHPIDAVTFNYDTVNSDTRFDAWTRHAIELSMAYRHRSLNNDTCYPAITLSGSIPFRGKNIFIAHHAQASCTLVFSYEF